MLGETKQVLPICLTTHPRAAQYRATAKPHHPMASLLVTQIRLAAGFTGDPAVPEGQSF